MGGGPKSRCVGRVSGLEGAVRHTAPSKVSCDAHEAFSMKRSRANSRVKM